MNTSVSAPTIGKAQYGNGDSKLFALAMKTGFLTLITVGIYRFWAKTRIRQYFWGNTRIDGEAFEYTGTGLEKLLGFLIAVVVLAVYLAMVQLILFQFGLAFVFQPRTQAQMLMQLAVIYLSFFAILPLLLFAQYRSRRYKLARTRFRGIRFGMVGAAGGYVWRAIVYLVLTICSLGVLWPLMTFRLEKYMTDRSWYGDSKFVQNGKWTGLYAAMKHIFIAVGIMVVVGAVGALTKSPVLFGLGIGLGYLWGIFGFVHYRVQSFAYLTNHKALGDSITFSTFPSTGTVLGKIILGSILIGILFVIVAGIGGAIAYFDNGDVLTGTDNPQAMSVVVAMAYLALLIFVSALSLVLITEPIIKHIVSETRVNNMDAMAAIKQRVGDKGADAEGFADALDWGGAI